MSFYRFVYVYLNICQQLDIIANFETDIIIISWLQCNITIAQCISNTRWWPIRSNEMSPIGLPVLFFHYIQVYDKFWRRLVKMSSIYHNKMTDIPPVNLLQHHGMAQFATNKLPRLFCVSAVFNNHIAVQWRDIKAPGQINIRIIPSWPSKILYGKKSTGDDGKSCTVNINIEYILLRLDKLLLACGNRSSISTWWYGLHCMQWMKPLWEKHLYGYWIRYSKSDLAAKQEYLALI